MSPSTKARWSEAESSFDFVALRAVRYHIVAAREKRLDDARADTLRRSRNDHCLPVVTHRISARGPNIAVSRRTVGQAELFCGDA